MVSTMLRGAGFERIGFERQDCDFCIGRDMDDAVERAMRGAPPARASSCPARSAAGANIASLRH